MVQCRVWGTGGQCGDWGSCSGWTWCGGDGGRGLLVWWLVGGVMAWGQYGDGVHVVAGQRRMAEGCVLVWWLVGGVMVFWADWGALWWPRGTVVTCKSNQNTPSKNSMQLE